MLKNIMTQLVNLKSTFQPQLWQGLELLFDSLLVVFWSTVMILFQVSSLLIWLLVGMLHRGLVLVSMLVEFVESILKFVVEKYSTQELFLSSRNLNLLSDVVPKMVFVVEVLLSTFQSGIKKLKTLLFSKTIKEQKIIESENLTTQSN